MAKLRLEQASVKEQDKRLKELEKEPDERGLAGGMPTELTKILQQQQTLLAKQVKLEEEREEREKEEKKKREKITLYSEEMKKKPEAHIMRAEDWLETSDPTIT